MSNSSRFEGFRDARAYALEHTCMAEQSMLDLYSQSELIADSLAHGDDRLNFPADTLFDCVVLVKQPGRKPYQTTWGKVRQDAATVAALAGASSMLGILQVATRCFIPGRDLNLYYLDAEDVDDNERVYINGHENLGMLSFRDASLAFYRGEIPDRDTTDFDGRDLLVGAISKDELDDICKQKSFQLAHDTDIERDIGEVSDDGDSDEYFTEEDVERFYRLNTRAYQDSNDWNKHKAGLKPVPVSAFQLNEYARQVANSEVIDPRPVPKRWASRTVTYRMSDPAIQLWLKEIDDKVSKEARLSPFFRSKPDGLQESQAQATTV